MRRRTSALRTLGSWVGGVTGSTVLWSAVVVAAVLVWLLPQADANIGVILLLLAITLIAGVVFGMLLLWLSARRFAKVAYAALSVVLVTGGLGLMVSAPVVRQMNTPDLAEYTGFTSLLLFGTAALLLGLVLAAMCVRWSMTRNARRSLSRWSRLLGAGYGVYMMLNGIGVLLLLFSVFGGEATLNDDGTVFTVVEQAISFAVFAALLIVPGLILTYHVISASMGEGSGAFRPPLALFGVTAFAVVLLVGQANMRMESPIAAPMPVLHVLAAVLPGITYIALAGRGSLLRGEAVAGLTWRQVTLSAAIGMSVAVTIAVYVESIGALYALVLLLVRAGVFEFAADAGEVWTYIGDSDVLLTENEQFIAGLFTASVLAPLSEEFGKGLGVRFMMRANTTRAQCFLLGAVAGAGFGFLEALLYGLAGISGDLDFWWAIMLIRGGSSSLHVICTGLTGVGWWYWTRARRHGVALSLFGTSVAIHAGWNAFATLIDSRILFLETLDNTLLTVVAYSIITVVSLAMIASIPLVARRLREYVTPVEGTRLAEMQPWLG